MLSDFGAATATAGLACVALLLLRSQRRRPRRDDSVASNAPMMAALDGLQKLFSADARPVVLARSAGLAAVNATGPVRRKIAWYAMGAA